MCVIIHQTTLQSYNSWQYFNFTFQKLNSSQASKVAGSGFLNNKFLLIVLRSYFIFLLTTCQTWVMFSNFFSH